MATAIALIDGTDGAYGAVFPDCPGCAAMGDTLDDVLINASHALREWLADRMSAGIDAVVFRTAAQLRADSEVREQIDEGALLSVVPVLLDAGRSVRANLSFDAGLLQAIDEAANARGLTRSSFLASAAREKIFAQ